ncbi:hypothetical protein HYPSUDRAFT_173712 [Hypholoma sublateritium FD-334 SS-4]|uniref:Uncharacterized protein n=1 Tax=Hypholoma sublateritium (strain FD-334 SS-4) TaxID=945553 RepID=A0A0D2N4D1_HYPSF|nr:hypothetical protein HYPSUDRAFT_173712 [Hypholoma sublateritium FD-334 SS-4]
MSTPSIKNISQTVQNDPFLWPQSLNHQSLRHLLSKGNARPTPGPDGWEKWFVKSLSDQALIIVATQPGTQGRDLISFISQYELWASRENIPLYVLQRDQKKGFDMLEPQGFYDAIEAYGLPRSIIDLDESSQRNVPYRIKTAYGFTDAFTVNGVTKQGGSLSPLKCTLTTSMCNQWIADKREDFAGSISVQSHFGRKQTPHTPSDHILLNLSIMEAMDDSLIPSSNLSSLKSMARAADRFQATYGWETEWRKSALYVYNTTPPDCHDARMPSVDYTDPQASATTWHEVPVITSHTTFLRVPVNKPAIQFAILRDLIVNFSFPPSTQKLPLTLLRRIITQNLISKIRPHLALQPISHQHATTLDNLIALKVHERLAFPFRFKTLVLTTPLDLRGLGFPSITRVNSALTIAGLHRDLNHHLTPFSKMAQISLADWTCKNNDCIHPLQLPYTSHATSPARQTYIPFSWALAQKTMSRIGLSLLCTDLHFITSGNVSIRHMHSLSLLFLPHIAPIPARTISNFEKHNLSLLSQFGTSSFSVTSRGPCYNFTPFALLFPSSQYYLTRDLPLLLDWFLYLPTLIRLLSHPDPSLLTARSERQSIAEASVTALATQSTAFPNATPHLSFATDASTISRHPTLQKPTTLAVVANNNAFVASLPHNPAAGILHGEAYAIAAASILARRHDDQITIYSDHLNSIRTLSHIPTSISLKNNPARSLYRWIQNIWQSLPSKPILSHVRAHTNSQTIPSQLNRLADHLATRSNSLSLPPPSLPLPTFFMDTYAPFSISLGYIESNLFSFADSRLSSIDAADLDTFHEPFPSLSCFDKVPAPAYPYTKAISSYSAVIQLYLRSGQLDTALSRSARLKDDQQPWCRLGCLAFEDPHHIFVECPQFNSLRLSRASELSSNITRILEASTTAPADRKFVHDRVQDLFLDSNMWPAGRSLFYLGVLPPLFPPMFEDLPLHTRIAHECHTASIRLAGQIWGAVRRRHFDHLSQNPRMTSTRTTLTLPSLLSHILPPNPSYPSFSVSFT